MSLARLRSPWTWSALVLLAVSGCSVPPERAAWKADEKVIQPMDGDGKTPGSLVIETVSLGTDNGKELRRAFFLYDDHGNYLTHYPNHSMSPVSLPTGRYVVVTSILNTNKRVQVVVKEGQTTFVRLSDFKSAPEAE
jgi:hypothetical protein